MQPEANTLVATTMAFVQQCGGPAGVRKLRERLVQSQDPVETVRQMVRNDDHARLIVVALLFGYQVAEGVIQKVMQQQQPRMAAVPPARDAS